MIGGNTRRSLDFAHQFTAVLRAMRACGRAVSLGSFTDGRAIRMVHPGRPVRFDLGCDLTSSGRWLTSDANLPAFV